MSTAICERSSLVIFSGLQVKSGWKWRDREGRFHLPSDMETRHLFYTLRMIWNNFMPVPMRVGKVNLYSFSGYYSDRYFAEAIVAIGRELLLRKNMRSEWLSQLEEMAAWLDKHPGLLTKGMQ